MITFPSPKVSLARRSFSEGGPEAQGLPLRMQGETLRGLKLSLKALPFSRPLKSLLALPKLLAKEGKIPYIPLKSLKKRYRVLGVLALLTLSFLLLRTPRGVAATWFDDSYSFRQLFTFGNTGLSLI